MKTEILMQYVISGAQVEKEALNIVRHCETCDQIVKLWNLIYPNEMGDTKLIQINEDFE